MTRSKQRMIRQSYVATLMMALTVLSWSSTISAFTPVPGAFCRPSFSSTILSGTTQPTSDAAAGSVSGSEEARLDPSQLDFVKGYLNKHHPATMLKIAETFSKFGLEKKKRFRPRFVIDEATVTHVTPEHMDFDVVVCDKTNKEKPSQTETVRVALGECPPPCSSRQVP